MSTRAKPSLRRHRAHCSICSHQQCAEIEAGFVSWESPAKLAQAYGLADRTSIYRHAHVFNLFKKRERNIRAALEKIIEKAGEVEVTSSAVVGAVQAYAKINAQGQWIERTQNLNLNEMFERMSSSELEAYAREGTLPGWFQQTVSVPGATATDETEEE